MTTPVRIGIMGTAKIARSVVPQILASENAVVVAVASRSLERAQQFAAEFAIANAYGSYNDLLNSDVVDAVYIPLPPSMHCEWTLNAAAAGKHVLCEKPLAISSAEAKQMIDAAIRQEIVLLDAVMWYHTARAESIRDIVHSGQLGTIRQITSAFTFPGDLLAADNLRFSSDLGGGSLLDVGWYCVGMSLWLMQQFPEQVFATGQWQNDVDLHMNGILWFPSHQMATFESGFNAVRRRWMEVAGSTAALVCDDFTKPWNPDKPRFWIHDASGHSHETIIPHPPIERCLIDAFCHLIQQRAVQHDWLKLSLQTQQVCESLLKSARQNSIVQVPLVRQW